MKRVLTVLVLLSVIATLSFSQGVLTPVWKLSPDKSFFKNDHFTRGIAYNPATDHILLPTRTVTHRIMILSAATGDSLGIMDMTGVSGGTYALNLAGATDDGVIYACNLTVSSTSPLKIYKWTNETAAPKLVYSGNPNDNRWGDALTVVGTGANARVWVSGTGSTAGNNEVAVLKLLNDTLVLDKKITLQNYVTIMGIAPVGTTGDVWINTANVVGTPCIKFNSSGVAVDTVPTTVASDASNSVTYVELSGKKYLLINDGTSQSGRVVDITNGGAKSYTRFWTGKLGTNANTNGTGLCVFDTKRKAMVIMATNNAIASYKIDSITNVTFTLNISPIKDTVGISWFVNLRGESPFSWDEKGPKMTNTDGDYWKATIVAPVNHAFKYKFYVANDVDGTSGQGWEDSFKKYPSMDNWDTRYDKVGIEDTVLRVQYYSKGVSDQERYWTPLVHGPDSLAVKFRINMKSFGDFNPDKHVPIIRGDLVGTGWDWNKNLVLKREATSGVAADIWSAILVMPKDKIGDRGFKYFVINQTDIEKTGWEFTRIADDNAGGDRKFTLRVDTTLKWVWWGNTPVAAVTGKDTMIINYRIDVSAAIKSRGFTLGDTILVSTGWGGSGKNVVSSDNPSRKFLRRVGTGFVYLVSDTIIGALNKDTYYSYYIVKGGLEDKEKFYNFDYSGTDAALGERRIFTGAKLNNINDTINSITSMRRMPDFKNKTKLTKTVTVTIKCDLRPAYYNVKAGIGLYDIQGSLGVFNADSVYIQGVWLNGPMSNGWTTWGGQLRDSLSKKMYDDGTHGDAVAGDRIYTCQLTVGPQYTSDQRQYVSQEFKFGVNGGDNEGGKSPNGSAGGFGNNHFWNIDETTGAYLIDEQFGSINPNYYKKWNYNTKVEVSDWVKQTSGVTDLLRPLVVINDNVAWAAGNNGVVLRTTDGGNNWVKSSPDANYNFYAFDAIDANTAWAWGTEKSVTGLGSCKIFKTSDGGATWTKQYENTNTYGNAICMFDANNGFAMGDPDDANGVNLTIVTTTNGGTAWTRVDAAKVPALIAGYYGLSNTFAKSGNSAWLTTYDDNAAAPCKLYKTTDKGANWTAYSMTTLPNGALPYIDFKDANNGVAATTAGKVTFTTDGGATWGAAVDVDATGGFRNAEWITGTNTVLLAGGGTSAGTVWKSTNAGKTWEKLTLPTGTARLRNIRFTASGTTGWGVGEGGGIVKYFGKTVISVKKLEVSGLPATFELSQNYPNPFNPETSIRYSLPKDVKVTLRIYDILGREVKTLVNDNQVAGTYEVKFNASHVASGAYFYFLKAGEFTSIKKMLLMK